MSQWKRTNLYNASSKMRYCAVRTKAFGTVFEVNHLTYAVTLHAARADKPYPWINADNIGVSHYQHGTLFAIAT